MAVSQDWWRSRVLYHIYPRSFYDACGDGHGDLPGIRAKLPYLNWLGVGGVWMSSISDSPNADWGYDVSDYRRPHPDFGTVEDVRALTAAGEEAGIAFLHDIVPNHTSDQHPWFQDALTGRDAQYRDYYVWADPAPDGGPPNNWVSMFGGSAWELDAPSGQYYLHNFTAFQPDLNWWNPAVRSEFEDLLYRWSKLGMRGFRIDVCQALIKDRLLRDNPPATAEDRENVRLRGQRPTFSMNRPEVHEILRSWRALAASLEGEPILLGETNTHDLEALAHFYGEAAHGPGAELQMAFNFRFMSQPYQADPLREIIAATEATLPEHAQPVWTLSNHDGSRYVTRWCENRQERVRGALMLLLCLRGTAMLYYGDELGLPDAPAIALELARDPLAHGTLPGKDSRDPCRAPMPWSDGPNSGFCPADATPWLPAHDGSLTSVQAQMHDSDSHARFTRAMIELRDRHPELSCAPMVLPEMADGVLSLGRGGLLCHINLTDAPVQLPGGEVLLATDRRREGERGETLELAPWQGAIIDG